MPNDTQYARVDQFIDILAEVIFTYMTHEESANENSEKGGGT